MSNDALKLKLIDKIITLKDVHQLRKIEATLQNILDNEPTPLKEMVLVSSDQYKENIVKDLNKPMRKSIDIEQLKKEQNFKPINKKVFFKLIDELNIEEPLEDLIRMI